MSGLFLLAIPTPSATPIPVFGSGVIGFSFLLSTIVWAEVYAPAGTLAVGAAGAIVSLTMLSVLPWKAPDALV